MSDDLDSQHAHMVRKLSKTGDQIISDLTPARAAVWHHATGIGTEAGELLTVAKAYAIYGKPVDMENVIEELGDLEFYLAGLRAVLQITREETLANNMRKLAKRYPGYQYSDQRAVERADKAELPQMTSLHEAALQAAEPKRATATHEELANAAKIFGSRGMNAEPVPDAGKSPHRYEPTDPYRGCAKCGVGPGAYVHNEHNVRDYENKNPTRRDSGSIGWDTPERELHSE